MVIIAVPSSKNGGLNDVVSPYFGRCSSFTFITIENNEIKVVKTVSNPNINAKGSKGVSAAHIVGMNNANIVIVGILGPNSAQVLSSLNLKILQAPEQQLNIKQVIDLYMQERLQELKETDISTHCVKSEDQ